MSLKSGHKKRTSFWVRPFYGFIVFTVYRPHLLVRKELKNAVVVAVPGNAAVEPAQMVFRLAQKFFVPVVGLVH